jgi:hypothetical protein
VSRRVFLGLFALTILSGCAVIERVFPALRPGGPVDPDIAIYRAAMADFSTCASTQDRAQRMAMAQRLTAAAAQLGAVTRPTNPDHFYITDRVTAAARYCAEATR